MQKKISISIRQKIYLSFSLLVVLFIINGIITIFTLNQTQKLTTHLSKEIDPSLELLIDFRKMMLESKIYTTNWVFLRFQQEDKESLKRLHNSDYPEIKARLKVYSSQWKNGWADSLQNVFSGFEKLLVIEKGIMRDLKQFNDYDDPVTKLEAERKVEEEILPRTASLMKSLYNVRSYWLNVRTQENNNVERSSMKLRWFIIFLAITIVCIGIFLSLYMASKIIKPVNKIRHIVNDLGKGITRKINYKIQNDEIGEMVHSVNNLSDKIQSTAAFAAEVGNRNFDTYFEPLSEEDTLGKALVAMRNNLKTSDESLNEAQHIAKLGSWEWDLVTNKLFWSDEVYNIFNINPATTTLTYAKYVEFIHPEDREYTNSVIAKCLQDHLPFCYEFRIISQTDVTKTISAEGKVSKNNKGEPTRLTGIVQDITERKKAQKELEDVNRELKILFNSIDEIFFSVNITTSKVIQISASCEKVYGYSQSEFLSNYRLWFEIIHPEDKYIIENEDEILQRGEHVDNQYRIIRKDKIIRWVETKITPTLDEHGILIRVDGITRDITERKNAEAALNKSEERYRQIVETAQEGIWMIDENNDTTFINKKMCEIIEYQPEEIKGKKIHSFMDSDARNNADEQIERRKQGISETHDSKFITKSGKIVWTSLSTNPIFDETGVYKGALAMITDISKRKHDEVLLQKSQAVLAINNLVLEQKNKELEQFAYVASHDLQEPLRTTISFVEMFKKQYFGKLDEKADQYLNYIQQASDRMRVLIKDLLDFSRIGINKDAEQVDCNIILHDVIADIDKAIKDSGAQIKAEHLPVISGYTTELKQLFQNLILNSIKFRKKEVRPEINITAQKKTDYWRFAVTDNGIGIDKQHNERIFIIFQRLHTRAEYQGSGIGLSHCKKIVELHHGKIWVESTPGIGSTFYFTIYSPKEKTNEPKVKMHNVN